MINRGAMVVNAGFLERLSALPIEAYQAGELVLRKGQTSGKVFILRQGSVEVLDGGQRIALANQPGTVFGEIGVLLDQPAMADVRVTEPSSFYVAAGRVFLHVHRDAALHVAGILARRLVAAHRNLDEVRRQLTERGQGLEDAVDAVDRSLLAPPS